MLLQKILREYDYESLLGDKLRHPRSTTDEKEAWQNCLGLADKYDKGMCEGYREQVDTLLVEDARNARNIWTEAQLLLPTADTSATQGIRSSSSPR